MRARPRPSSLALAVVVTVAAWGVLGSPSAARAAGGDDAAADAAIRRGVDLRKQGHDADALEEFRKAYAIAKTPRALAQIALAEQALGRWVDAESDLEQAMASKSDAWIRKNVATLSGALDVIRRHLGSLDVIGPEGAELRIDGRSTGKLPLAKPARVPIGNLTIEVRKPGFFPATRPVSIAVGELTRESMDLQPVDTPTASPAAGVPARLAPAPIAGAPADARLVAPPGPMSTGGGAAPPSADTGGRRTWQRPLAWTTAAVAVLGGVGGGAALWIRSGQVNNANDLACNVDSNDQPHPMQTSDLPHCQELVRNASNARTAAVVSFSAAGALAIASAILFATMPSSSDGAVGRAPVGSTIACAPTLAAATTVTGVSCQLRF